MYTSVAALISRTRVVLPGLTVSSVRFRPLHLLAPTAHQTNSSSSSMKVSRR